MAVNVGNLSIQITAGVALALADLKKLNDSLGNTSSKLKKATKEAVEFSAKATVGLTKVVSGLSLMSTGIKTVTNLYSKFGDEIKDSLKMSMEYIENVNLFNVSMGESVEKATAFQNALNEAFGTNLSDTVRYQAVFQQMASAIGITNKQAYLLSETMTKLGYDISSFYNIDIEDAMSKLQAGLAGQTKPLRSLGMDITQQTLEPVLESLGITDRSVSQLNQAEKMILRYITILRQSTNAQTDMARTLDQPANQLRILTEQVKETGRWFGNVFIGTFGAILPYINAVVMVLKELLKALATLAGFQDYIAQFSGSSAVEIPDGEDLSDNLSDAEKSSKKIHDNLQSIDEVHNLTEDTSSSSSGTTIGGIDSRLLEAMEGYDNLMSSVNSKASQVRDKLMEWLGFTKQINEETNEIYFTYTGDGWSDVGVKLTEAFQYATDFLVEKIHNIPWEDIGMNISEVLESIDFSTIGVSITTILYEAVLGLQDLLLTIDWATILGNIGDGLEDTFSNISEYLGEIKWEEIRQTISESFLAIDWLAVGNSIINALGEALKGIGDLFAEIDWAKVGETVGEAVRGWINNIHDVLLSIDWLAIGNGLYEFFSNLDIWAIMGDLLSLLLDALGIIIIELIYAIGGLLEPLTDAINDWLTGVLEGIVTYIVLFILGIVDLFMSLYEDVKAIVEFLVEAVIFAFEVLWEGIKAIVGFIFDSIVFIFVDIPLAIWDCIKGVGELFGKAFKSAYDFTVSKITDLVNYVKKLPNTIWTAIKTIPDKFKQAFQNAKNKVSEIWKSVTSMFSSGGKIFDGIKEGIAETFKSIVNTLITGINKVIAKPFETINKTLNSIRNTTIPIIDVKPFSGLWDKNPIPVPQIPQLATGGFPDKGSLFIANEKAPELVGNIGNNTAVVNNEQIVQSVSRGVAQAVAGALGSGAGETEIYGEIDGQQLIKIVVKGVNGMTTKNGKFPFKLA